MVENNSFNINNTIGKTADVYLAIPEKKTGKGKVQLSVKGAFHELDAVTENERIETGAVVKIVSTEGSNLAIVEKLP